MSVKVSVRQLLVAYVVASLAGVLTLAIATRWHPLRMAVTAGGVAFLIAFLVTYPLLSISGWLED